MGVILGTKSMDVEEGAAFVNVTIGGTVNDWNPTGLSTGSALRITSATGTPTIGGIEAPDPDVARLLFIINVSGTAVSFAHDSGDSRPTNRILVPSTIMVKISNNTMVILWRDTSSQCWRVLAAS